MIETGFIYPALFCLFLASVVVVGFEDFDTQEMSLSVLLVSGVIAIFSAVYANFLSNTAARGFAPDIKSSVIGALAVSLPILIIGFVITPLLYKGFLSPDHKLRRRFQKRLRGGNLTESENAKITKLLEEVNARITERGAVYGFGMGDVVLMAAAGIMIGYKAVIAGTFFAVIIAAVYAVIKAKINERRNLDTETAETAENDINAENSNAFAFGPFLCIGIALGAFFGNSLWGLYFSQFAQPVTYV
jgi:prepilin signal peptidase PulO-like enzyme (type II secretory pathway)